MRGSGKIKHKLRQVVYRHRKRFIDDGLKRKPNNCQHNCVAKLPAQIGNKTVVRLCMFGAPNGETWNNRVCDESLGGNRVAQNCPYFEANYSADELKALFASMLGLDGTKVTTEEIGQHYPDIAALTWVLGEDALLEDDGEWEEPDG